MVENVLQPVWFVYRMMKAIFSQSTLLCLRISTFSELSDMMVRYSIRALRAGPRYFRPTMIQRSLATSAFSCMKIDTQVIDDIKAYPSALQPVSTDVKHFERKSLPKALRHAYAGMTGGQIFHEMMIQHGVDCICECGV